jgi:hypothetical protein
MRIGHSGVAKRLVLAAMLLSVWFAPALAQQPTPDQIAAIRQSCRADFMSRCTGVQPGGKDALECLKRNAGSVSASCRSALDAVGPKPAAGGAEPAPVAAPPPAAPPAPAANKPEPAGAPPASPPEPPPATGPPAPERGPTEAGNPPSPQVAAVGSACRADFGVHCPGVKPGGAAALRCLQVNAAALSPRCRRAVEAIGEGGAAPPPAAAAPEAPASAPPPVAPLGPIPPMPPRQALEILSFCGPERAALCGDVPPGGGRIIQCLAEQAPRLSPTCYGAIARAIR